MSESPISPTERRGDPCFQDNVGRTRLRPSCLAGTPEKHNSRRTGRTKNRAVYGDFLVTFFHTNRTLREQLPNSLRPGRSGNRWKRIRVALFNRLPASLLAMAGNAIGGFELRFDYVTWLWETIADRRLCFGISRGSELSAGSIRDVLKHNLLDYSTLPISWMVGANVGLSILPGI